MSAKIDLAWLHLLMNFFCLTCQCNILVSFVLLHHEFKLWNLDSNWWFEHLGFVVLLWLYHCWIHEYCLDARRIIEIGHFVITILLSLVTGSNNILFTASSICSLIYYIIQVTVTLCNCMVATVDDLKVWLYLKFLVAFYYKMYRYAC